MGGSKILLPLTGEINDKKSEFPKDNFDFLFQNDLLKVGISKEFNGLNLPLKEIVTIVNDISYVCPSTALIYIMTVVFSNMISKENFNSSFKKIVLTDIAENGNLINSFNVESGLGSLTKGRIPKTIAKKIKNGWLLTGEKIYCTGGKNIKWASIYATTDENRSRRGMFVINTNNYPSTITQKWNGSGMTASCSDSLQFENAFVADEFVYNIDYIENPVIRPNPVWFTVLLTVTYFAIAKRAKDILINFIIKNNYNNEYRFLETLGKIESLVQINESLINLGISLEFENFNNISSQLALIKYNVINNSIQIVSLVSEITTGFGLSINSEIPMLMRDVQCGRVHAPHNHDVLISVATKLLNEKY